MRPKENLEERLIEVAGEVVTATLAELPEEIAAEIGQVSVFVEGQPGPHDLELGVGSDWLGLFEGPSHGRDDFPAPSRIRVWVNNIWTFCGAREADFREEVRVTVLHEIGHYLGLDEEQVARLGLE